MSSSPNLAEILGKINDGICVFSTDGRVSFVNDKASEILKTADEWFHTKINRALTEPASARFDHFHASLNRWFEHRAYPNPEGGLILISCDVTSRHRLEQALRASEERFQRVIESDIMGVIVVENGLISQANDMFLKMVGYARADLIRNQLRWREMTPPEFDTLDASARKELGSRGTFSPYEKEFLRQDGTRIPVVIAGVAMQAHLETHETLCLVLDVSERKKAEERLRAIVEAGKILASSLDCESTFAELAEFIVSKVADSCTIIIQQDGRMIRMAASHSAPLPPEGNFQATLERVLSTGESDLTIGPISRIFVPIPTRNEIAGVLAVASARPEAFDTEDLHLLELFGQRAGLALENARLYHETQKANRLKDEFVAIISHELRTPLTPILGGIYMIRSEPRDEAIFARALDLIERNAKTQVKIVDDLLDVSRALSGKLRLNMEPVDLPRVIHAAVETVRPTGEAKGIRLDVRVGPVSGVIFGDTDRLQQVVWNLLANAMKFTPNSGTVTVELVETSGHAEIRVTDTGIGIEADFLPHVFERFQQANTSRTRPHGGLGLGLAIVRHLVESHGGTVHAYSSGDEQGAVFVVRLPLRRTAQVSTM